jgi:hypothetical protein
MSCTICDKYVDKDRKKIVVSSREQTIQPYEYAVQSLCVSFMITDFLSAPEYDHIIFFYDNNLN